MHHLNMMDPPKTNPEMDKLLSRSHAAYWMLVTRSALYHEIVYSLIRSKSLVTPAGLFSLDVLIPRQES